MTEDRDILGYRRLRWRPQIHINFIAFVVSQLVWVDHHGSTDTHGGINHGADRAATPSPTR